jgi:hypothetical protein
VRYLEGEPREPGFIISVAGVPPSTPIARSDWDDLLMKRTLTASRLANPAQSNWREKTPIKLIPVGGVTKEPTGISETV